MGHFVVGILGGHLAVKDVVENIVGVLLPIGREEGDHIACFAFLSSLFCCSEPIKGLLISALPVILHIFLHLWVKCRVFFLLKVPMLTKDMLRNGASCAIGTSDLCLGHFVTIAFDHQPLIDRNNDRTILLIIIILS